MTDRSQLLGTLKIDRGAAPATNPRKRRWIGLTVIAVMALAAGVTIALRPEQISHPDPGIQASRVPAALTSAGTSANRAVLDASGYVVARRMATVSSKVTGRVSVVLIEEGQYVTAGQILARLDPVDADAQHALSASQLAAARSQIASVAAQLKEAEANAARLSALIGRKLVAAAQLDAAIAQRDSLRAQLVTAERNAEVAEDNLRIADIGVDNTIVRAPFAGVVIAKAAQPGEIVSPLSAGGGYTRTGICTLVDMDSLEVEVEVGEAYIGRVKPGMPVETVLNAYQDWKIPGRVIAIIPAADRGKATVRVRIGLDAKDARIVPDMGARVSFHEAAGPTHGDHTSQESP